MKEVFISFKWPLSYQAKVKKICYLKIQHQIQSYSHNFLFVQLINQIQILMVVLGFVFMGRAENVQSVQMPQDADWHVTLKCGHCHEQFPKEVTFNKNETIEMIKQHGIAHFGASCKNCDRKCFVTIDQSSSYIAKPNQDGLIKQTIAKIQCRGCEVTKVNLGNSMTVTAANSGMKFQNADFTDLWCEMDEQTNLLVQIEDPKLQIVHLNDKK